MNVSRWFRWFPVAFGRKNALTLTEQIRALGTVGAPPVQKQPANKAKLKLSKLRVVQERRRA